MNYPYYQPNVYPTQVYVTPNNPQQAQNGGIVSVRSEEEARNYPVAIGNVVTFKDESAPYIYTKTMGFSQYDRPVFERYKREVEEIKEPNVAKTDIESLWDAINEIKSDIEKPATRRKKAGENANDE